MRDLSRKLVDDLKSVPGDIVVVHSGLMGLRSLGLSVPGLVNIISDIYSDRLLVMPSYTSDFPKTHVFDLAMSEPYTGGICQEFMSRSGVLRTPHAMNSYLIRGKPPVAFERLSDGWREDSVMGFLVGKNATFISLGVSTLKSCAYYHYAEEVMKVPYRYYKTFHGELRNNGDRISEISATMFVGPLKCPQIFWATPADETLERNGKKRKGLFLSWMPMADIVDAATKCLEQDPYSLLQNPMPVRAYVESGGLEREVAALAA